MTDIEKGIIVLCCGGLAIIVLMLTLLYALKRSTYPRIPDIQEYPPMPAVKPPKPAVKTITEIEHRAYLFGVIVEILKEKGCTSENETVHVPTLIADFIDGLKNEIAMLKRERDSRETPAQVALAILGKITGAVCEAEGCTKNAAIMVRDVREVPPKNNKDYRQWEPKGRPHFFCDDHKRDSITFPLY